MNKDAEDRIWLLLSNKLANEATKDELQELNHRLKLDPNINHRAEIIQDWWNSNPSKMDDLY